MVKKTQEEFLEEAKNTHGDKYDYSISIYNGGTNKIKILCPIHGIFEQSPIKHINGKHNCPKCAKINMAKKQRKSKDSFIKEAINIHGNKYNYELSNYTSYGKKINIICPIHGEFEQIASNHLKGKGCKYCGGTSKMDTKIFITKSKEIHKDKFIYEKTIYGGGKEMVTITCKDHGDFKIYPSNHLSKEHGCPYCLNKVFDTISFIKKSKEKYKDKFSYEKTYYNNTHEKIIIRCDKHGDINTTPLYHLNSECGCNLCCNNYSKIQIEIKDFITSFGLSVLSNDRSILINKEIDILIPEKKIGVEFNGLYWHSDEFKPKEYHLEKTESCEEKGIKLIHIFEDEWVSKKDIIKSMLTHKLGLTKNIIYARKCEIKFINSVTVKNFLDLNHIQGSTNSTYKIGLFYKDELVSVLTAGKRGILKNKDYEIIRFCNKINNNVIGSFSKLLKFFIREIKPNKIITYSDRRFGNGDVYNKNGFNFIKNTEINYYYLINKKRENRVKFQKHKLVSMGYDKNKTEKQIMLEMGVNKIYDCGNKKWALTL